MGLSSVIRTFPTSKYSETSRQAREMYFFLSLGFHEKWIPNAPRLLSSWLSSHRYHLLNGRCWAWNGMADPCLLSPCGAPCLMLSPLALLCLPLH